MGSILKTLAMFTSSRRKVSSCWMESLGVKHKMSTELFAKITFPSSVSKAVHETLSSPRFENKAWTSICSEIVSRAFSLISDSLQISANNARAMLLNLKWEDFKFYLLDYFIIIEQILFVRLLSKIVISSNFGECLGSDLILHHKDGNKRTLYWNECCIKIYYI